MQRVHLKVRVGVFNCQQILAKISFVSYLWYCDEKQIECGFAWYRWNSTDLGLIDMFLINLNTEIVACILSFRKSRHKPNLENTTKYGFSPDLGGKMAAFWACACKLSWTLLSPAQVQPLYGEGKKGMFRDWTNSAVNVSDTWKFITIYFGHTFVQKLQSSEFFCKYYSSVI